MVCQTEQFVALMPFWAVWPFQTLVLPRAHRGALPDLWLAERSGLADVLGRLTRRYDRLFQVTFPYSMGLHQRHSWRNTRRTERGRFRLNMSRT